MNGTNESKSMNSSALSKGSPPLFRSATLVEKNQSQTQSKVVVLRDDKNVSQLEDDKSNSPATMSFVRRSIPNGWHDPKVTTVGMYYPLGPCQIRINWDRLEEYVFQLLPEVFRQLSLQTIYQESPVCATCRSIDQVEFEVSIFRSRTDLDEIIVEIERQDGDVISYHRYASQIVCALSGETVYEESFASLVCWDQNIWAFLDSISQPGSDEIVADALETTWTMISSERYDTQRLGLESLIHMTDPTKSGFSVAKAASECLLFPKDSVQLRVSLNVFSCACDDTTNEDYHFSSPGSVVDRTVDSNFAYLSLIIVSQVFQMAAEAKTINVESFLNDHSNDVFQSILQKLEGVGNHPHLTYFAVRSLLALCDCVPSLRSRIQFQDVEEAQRVGDCCHLALANATNKLILNLQA